MEDNSENDKVITIKNLTKIYRSARRENVKALDDISFSVRDKEFMSIVGPSGGGKTTLLRIIAGLIPRTNGEVILRGNPVEGPSEDLGFVFQFPTLLPWRSVINNVLFPVEIQGLSKEELKDRAYDLLELVGLSGFEDSYPEELSGGMKARVGICRALVGDPALLLMDEPFGTLDAMTRDDMNQELLRIWKEAQKTILFVTHDIYEAVYLADRVLVLSSRPGKILDISNIDLPRPREQDMKVSEKFMETTARIREMIEQA